MNLNKYLKYKNKYLKLKEQIGGVTDTNLIYSLIDEKNKMINYLKEPSLIDVLKNISKSKNDTDEINIIEIGAGTGCYSNIIISIFESYLAMNKKNKINYYVTDYSSELHFLTAVKEKDTEQIKIIKINKVNANELEENSNLCFLLGKVDLILSYNAFYYGLMTKGDKWSSYKLDQRFINSSMNLLNNNGKLLIYGFTSTHLQYITKNYNLFKNYNDTILNKPIKPIYQPNINDYKAIMLNEENIMNNIYNPAFSKDLTREQQIILQLNGLFIKNVDPLSVNRFLTPSVEDIEILNNNSKYKLEIYQSNILSDFVLKCTSNRPDTRGEKVVRVKPYNTLFMFQKNKSDGLNDMSTVFKFEPVIYKKIQ